MKHRNSLKSNMNSTEFYLASSPGEYKWLWKMSFTKTYKEDWNSVTAERSKNNTPY